MKKNKRSVEKKLDKLTDQLGATVSTMTAEEKAAYGKTQSKYTPQPKRRELTDKELKRIIKLMIDKAEKRFTVEPFNAVLWRSTDDCILYDFISGETPLYPQAEVDHDCDRDIVGYYMGVLVGALMMGATREKLNSIG